MVKFTPSAGLFGGEITRELPEITRDYPRLTESRKAGLFGGELAVRRADEAARLGGGAALADGAPFSARPLATGSPLNLLGTFLQAPPSPSAPSCKRSASCPSPLLPPTFGPQETHQEPCHVRPLARICLPC